MTFRAQQEEIEQQLATAINVQTDELASTSLKEDENIAELRQKSQDFDTLIYSLKEKYKEVDRQKIDSDSDPGTTFMVLLRSEGLFQATDYMVRVAKRIVSERGILELPGAKKKGSCHRMF